MWEVVDVMIKQDKYLPSRHKLTNKWGDTIDTSHGFFAMTVLVNKLIIVHRLSPNGVINQIATCFREWLVERL